jgi:hypothetical protein
MRDGAGPEGAGGARRTTGPGVDLHWLPLGAGGWFVRSNGRVYERLRSRLERRPAFDLYHSALEVGADDGRYVIETAWPIPDDRPASRGVVADGPVGSRAAGRFRVLRYEVRCWREGTIPDIAWVAETQHVSDDAGVARRIVEAAGSVPRLVWGRDELRTGDMWNSNSVVSWLLSTAGVPAEAIAPPPGGRAPGWRAGIVAARR